MIIGIDARPLGDKQPAGISYYLRHMLWGFSRVSGVDLRFILYSHKPVNYSNEDLDLIMRTGDGRIPGSIWVQTVLPMKLKKEPPDIFWGPVQVLPFKLPKKTKGVVTIHDLVFKLFPRTMSTRNLIITRMLVPHSLRIADAIVSDSYTTAKDLNSFYPFTGEKTHVISPGTRVGLTSIPREQANKVLRERLGIDYPYLLTLGSLEPRKNLPLVYKSFLRVSEKIPHHLVCAGPGGWKT